MQQHRRARVLVTSLALCVVLLLACGLSALVIPRATSLASHAQQLADARKRWQSLTMPHYRLVMQAPSWCRLDVEIQSEKVVHVFENTCPTSPRPITGLFDLIKLLDRTADTTWPALWGFVVHHGLPNCLTPPDIDLMQIVSLNPIS